MTDIRAETAVSGPPGPVAPAGDDVRTPTGAIVRRPGVAELNPRTHSRRRRTLEISLGIAVPFFLLGLWQVAATEGWIDDRLYPRPTDIVREGQEMWEQGLLWDAVWVTAKNSLLGFAYGAVLGLAFGLVMGMSRTVRSALEPLLNALYTVPKIALLGVFITIFGIDDSGRVLGVLPMGPKLALTTVTVFFFVWIATMAAVMSVPEGYREAAMSFGSSRRQMFRHVLLPAALPQIFVGMRIAAGVAILVLVSAEGILGTTSGGGLGQVIFGARQLGLYARQYLGIVLAALLGVLFAEAVRLVGRLLTPWAPEDRAIAAR